MLDLCLTCNRCHTQFQQNQTCSIIPRTALVVMYSLTQIGMQADRHPPNYVSIYPRYVYLSTKHVFKIYNFHIIFPCYKMFLYLIWSVLCLWHLQWLLHWKTLKWKPLHRPIMRTARVNSWTRLNVYKAFCPLCSDFFFWSHTVQKPLQRQQFDQVKWCKSLFKCKTK